ncbi:hypothetical protein Peur_007469 [Populus x canadensis]
MKCWKIISFTTSEQKNMSKNPAKLIPFKTLLHTLPLALSHLLYMLPGHNGTVRAINVPMYTTLRSTAVAFTMIEYLLTGRKHSLRVFGRSKTESTVAVPILVANLAKICSILTSRTQEKPQVSLTMPKMTWHS